MASGLFAILDDIAVLLDDVVVMSKLATKNTAGILGDDLAVNAEKATGFVASREIPVLWAITKGSFLNKIIILPFVFVLNYFIPILVKYILIIGGIYLAYEGIHKIFETLLYYKNKKSSNQTAHKPEITSNEKEKIRAAIVTDFILSVEIIIIALATVTEKGLSTQILTVTFVAMLATVGVYGLVALIIRLDDFGLFLISKSKGNKLMISLGNALVRVLPLIIRFLSVVGTVALILVAGGIFMHNLESIYKMIPLTWPSIISEALLGLAGGLTAFALISVGSFGLKKLGLIK